MGPAFTFNLTITLIGSLSSFGIILAMTQGGPVRTTAVMNFLVFEQFAALRWGYATAITLVKFIVVSVIAVPVIYFLRRREVEY